MNYLNNQDVILEGKKLFLGDLARTSGELRELQCALLITQSSDGNYRLSSLGIHPAKLEEIKRILVS